MPGKDVQHKLPDAFLPAPQRSHTAEYALVGVAVVAGASMVVAVLIAVAIAAVSVAVCAVVLRGMMNRD